MKATKSFYRLAWLLALAGCAETHGPLSGGSESHFLSCKQDVECGVLGPEFQCVAGRCREPLQDEGSALSEDAAPREDNVNEDNGRDDGDVQTNGNGGTGVSAGAGGVSGDGETSALVGSGGTTVARVAAGGDCEAPDYEPLEALAGETCYELQTHNDSAAAEPFVVESDESINQLYYDVPWPADSVATRFGADFDQGEVIRQWLLFSTSDTTSVVQRNVTGTTLGEQAKVLAGWNVGGCNVTLPSDMGLELPDPSSGKRLMVQWHHGNYTGAPQSDTSKIQICVVPRSTRPNIGGLTLLGTENLGGSSGMSPGIETKSSGTCLNETSEPITIVAFRPSMRLLGTNMYTEIARDDGSVEAVFDQPFVFDNQVHYMTDPTVVMQPGDKIRSECTFFNNTPSNVSFGVSANSETCLQYVFSYPAGALDKPENVSLIGATNTCWGDD